MGVARILHIEDDPKNRLLVRKILGAAGHEVVDATTGLEGVRLAGVTPPDLVLVDINIPDLDGYEVTLRLRGMPALAGVPIVAITAEGDRQTSLAVGADGFIEKPIDASRFPRTVARFLEGHRERPDDTHERRLRERSQKIVERLERKVVELQEVNARLEEVARLRREFLQNMSHELATPLTPVVGYLQLLLDGELGALTPLQRKCLGQVAESTTRLRTLIDTLLDVSAIETGRMHFFEHEYDFAETVARAVESMRGTFAERGVTLREEPRSRPLGARGDPEKLVRAFVHVLENAAKFTPRGGEVAVGIRTMQSPAGEVEHALLVADSGPGVPKEQAQRVFEPFYQVDGSPTRSHGGVGLGLAFARRVCEALGGGVELASPPNAEVALRILTGTLVTLRVRARGEAHDEPAPPP